MTSDDRRTVRVYSPQDRPDVLVELPEPFDYVRADGRTGTAAWAEGELLQWMRRDSDVSWWGQVVWRPTAGVSSKITVFAADRIHEHRVCDWWRGARSCHYDDCGRPTTPAGSAQ